MAKRGRKKKSKVMQLSTQDKSHLSRILKKVRLIKQNKAAEAPAKGNGSDLRLAQQQLAILQKNFNTFLATQSPTQTGYQVRFDQLAKAVASQQAIVFKLMGA